jgi:hypothetical protein
MKIKQIRSDKLREDAMTRRWRTEIGSPARQWKEEEEMVDGMVEVKVEVEWRDVRRRLRKGDFCPSNNLLLKI